MQLTPHTITPAKGIIGHNKKAKLLIADISDLQLPGFISLYDDAIDVGFALRNAKTGNITRWAMATEVRCPRENEVIGWMCVPCSESIYKNPQLAGYSFNINND